MKKLAAVSLAALTILVGACNPGVDERCRNSATAHHWDPEQGCIHPDHDDRLDEHEQRLEDLEEWQQQLRKDNQNE